MRYELARITAGLTVRQADYWRTAGYIEASAEGSGIASEITVAEAHVLLRMARLVRAGFTVAKAAEIARGRTGYDTFLALGDGIHLLIYENQPTEAAS